MYIRKDKRKSGSTTIRIVEGRRVNGKVRQKHILHIDTVRTEAGIRNAEAKAKKILGQFDSGEMYINRLGRVSVRKTTKRKYTKRQKTPSSGCPTCGKGKLVASDEIPDRVKLNEVSYSKRMLFVSTNQTSKCVLFTIGKKRGSKHISLSVTLHSP